MVGLIDTVQNLFSLDKYRYESSDIYVSTVSQDLRLDCRRERSKPSRLSFSKRGLETRLDYTAEDGYAMVSAEAVIAPELRRLNPVISNLQRLQGVKTYLEKQGQDYMCEDLGTMKKDDSRGEVMRATFIGEDIERQDQLDRVALHTFKAGNFKLLARKYLKEPYQDND